MSRIILEARSKLGLSQHELALLAKVARITIANVELGKHVNIRPATAYKLAKALKLEPSDILPDLANKANEKGRTSIPRLLSTYSSVKEGTVMEPTGRERAWLERVLAAWGDEMIPTHASVLFLILARRHGTKA